MAIPPVNHNNKRKFHDDSAIANNQKRTHLDFDIVAAVAAVDLNGKEKTASVPKSHQHTRINHSASAAAVMQTHDVEMDRKSQGLTTSLTRSTVRVAQASSSTTAATVVSRSHVFTAQSPALFAKIMLQRSVYLQIQKYLIGDFSHPSETDKKVVNSKKDEKLAKSPIYYYFRIPFVKDAFSRCQESNLDQAKRVFGDVYPLYFKEKGVIKFMNSRISFPVDIHNFTQVATFCRTQFRSELFKHLCVITKTIKWAILNESIGALLSTNSSIIKDISKEGVARSVELEPKGFVELIQHSSSVIRDAVLKENPMFPLLKIASSHIEYDEYCFKICDALFIHFNTPINVKDFGACQILDKLARCNLKKGFEWLLNRIFREQNSLENLNPIQQEFLEKMGYYNFLDNHVVLAAYKVRSVTSLQLLQKKFPKFFQDQINNDKHQFHYELNSIKNDEREIADQCSAFVAQFGAYDELDSDSLAVLRAKSMILTIQVLNYRQSEKLDSKASLHKA